MWGSLFFEAKFRGVLERVLLKERRVPWPFLARPARGWKVTMLEIGLTLKYY